MNDVDSYRHRCKLRIIAPAPHGGVEYGLDDQWAVLHQKPLDGLDGHAGSGPGGRVAGRHFTCVDVTGFERRPGLALDHRDLVPCLGEVVGGGGANHADAEDGDFSASVSTYCHGSHGPRLVFAPSASSSTGAQCRL